MVRNGRKTAHEPVKSPQMGIAAGEYLRKQSMIYKLVVPGRLPGANEYINAERGNRYKAAKMKKDAQALIGRAIRQQLGGLRITEPVRIRYLWVEPNRKRDKSNICFARKFLEDALVTMGVLRNDGWNEIVGFSDEFAVDADNPRIEIEIEVMEK